MKLRRFLVAIQSSYGSTKQGASHRARRKSVVVKSQTGSGKTASFGIPLCELVNWEENKPQALVLTPTRELAAQVKEDITNIGRFKRIKAAAVYGKITICQAKSRVKAKNTYCCRYAWTSA